MKYIEKHLTRYRSGFFLPLLAHAATVASPKIIILPKKIGPGDIITVCFKSAAGPVTGTF